MRKYTFDENYFESIDSVTKAHILGFIAADGCVCNKKNGQQVLCITIHDRDRSILEKIRQEMQYTGPLTKRGPYTSLTITSKKVFSDLGKLGIVPKKSLVLTFPTSTQVDSSYTRAYIRGYFEGDGCMTLGTKKDRLNGYFNLVGTRWFLEEVQKYLKQHTNVDGRIDKRGNIYVYSFGGNIQVLRVAKHIYEGATFVMERKYQKMLELSSFYDGRGTKRTKNFYGNRKEGYLLSPAGEVYQIKNISAFSRKYDLQVAHVSNLLNGKLHHHKRWTVPDESTIQTTIDNGTIKTSIDP